MRVLERAVTGKTSQCITVTKLTLQSPDNHATGPIVHLRREIKSSQAPHTHTHTPQDLNINCKSGISILLCTDTAFEDLQIVFYLSITVPSSAKFSEIIFINSSSAIADTSHIHTYHWSPLSEAGTIFVCAFQCNYDISLFYSASYNHGSALIKLGYSDSPHSV